MIFRHSGNVGDVIHSLPTVRAMAPGRAVLLLQPGQPADYCGPHPLGNVRLSHEYASAVLPLLRKCLYLAGADIYQGEPVDIDLDAFRTLVPNYGGRLDRGCIARWHCAAYRCCPDLSTAWLTAKPADESRGLVLVSRTARYHSPRIHYRALSKCQGATFLGLPAECEAFNRRYGLRLPHIQARDWLHLAQLVAGCRAFIGNQSAAYAVAEGLKKTPRALEVCPDCPNVIPIGPQAYELWTAKQLEEMVASLAI